MFQIKTNILSKGGLILLLLIFQTSCKVKKDTGFSFVQICDTQLGFGTEGYEQDLVSFKQSVNQINELNPDFVVICGDLVHVATDSTFQDFKNIKQHFKMPCYVAPGNHDIGNNPDAASLGFYRKTFGKDYYEFKNKGYSFIVTNTQLWKSDVENESEKHYQWFTKTLKIQSKKQHPVFVIGHYPLYTEQPDEKEHYYNFPLETRRSLLKLFEEHHVKAYLSGHTHKLVINNYKNIQLVSGETLSRNFDKSPLGFRLWQVSENNIQQRYILLN